MLNKCTVTVTTHTSVTKLFLQVIFTTTAVENTQFWLDFVCLFLTHAL